MYSCTAVGPLIARISPGVIEPSESGVPARTKSFSCTRICFDRGTRYFLTSPSLEVTMISRLPRFTLPMLISPSISLTTAGLLGLRASNNSVTRGRPPVISPALPTTRGILTRISPALSSWPSSTTMWPLMGKLYVRITSPFSSRIWQLGTWLLSLDSITIRSRRPVASSSSTRKLIPSVTFSNCTLPAFSVTITALKGSHLAITVSLSTCWPSLTKSCEP